MPTNPETAVDLCPNCQHPRHLPGTECATPVNHGPSRFHLCLCLARPGAALPCPPQMTCQDGTLGYADIWYLQRGHTLTSADGEVSPEVLGLASVGFPTPDPEAVPAVVSSPPATDRATILREAADDLATAFGDPTAKHIGILAASYLRRRAREAEVAPTTEAQPEAEPETPLEKRLRFSERRNDELRTECLRRGKTVAERGEKIRELEKQLDEVRSQLGAEILRAGQAEAELRRMADEAQQPEPTAADKAAALGMADAEYRAHSHRAAVDAIRAAIPGLYATVGLRVEEVLAEEPAAGGAGGVADETGEGDRKELVVGYRSANGDILRCSRHAKLGLVGMELVPVTTEDLPSGGLCTYPGCGADVLIPQQRDTEA